MNIQEHKYSWLIFLGGMILVFNAGYINTISLLGFFDTAATHMTGNASKMAMKVAAGEYKLALKFLAILVTFVAGSTLTGVMIVKPKFSLSIRYTRAFIYQALLMIIAWLLFLAHAEWYGELVIVFAAGMQNALFTKFSDAEVRTTHITGILTDLGIQIGHILRGSPDIKWWKIKLFLATAFSFCFGGLISAMFFAKYKFSILLFPICLMLLLATAYPIIQIANKK